MLRKAARALVALLVLAGVLGAPRPAAADPVAPVHPFDFPDPSAIQVGGRYYAYATNVFPYGYTVNVPVLTTTDTSSWSWVGDALPQLGSWARGGYTWAPSVSQVGGGFVLYYTATEVVSGKQCIGRATSTSPTGPFVDGFGAPIVCQLDRGGSIDPSAFLAPDGSRWLLWKSEDDTLGRPSLLWSARLTADGTNLASGGYGLLTAGAPWEGRTIEGPTMVASGATFFLLYGGGDWRTGSYAIGYATCSSPAGPCHNATTSGPWASADNTGIAGPGGPSVLRRADGSLLLFFHGWINAVGYANGGVRAMYVQPLDLSRGFPLMPALHPIGNRYLRDTPTSGDASVVLRYGDPGDVQLACDWDGDGVDTPGVFRQGVWYVRNENTSGDATSSFRYGDPGDVPVCGDWDGNGTDTPGVVRNGRWYLRNSNTSGVADGSYLFGDPGDAPVVGRWATRGDSIGVHRGGRFLLASDLPTAVAGVADIEVGFGDPGDVAVVGDWDGNGTDTVGVFRNGRWYLRNSNQTGVAEISFTYGDPTDHPIVGDWDGGGGDEPGITR